MSTLKLLEQNIQRPERLRLSIQEPTTTERIKHLYSFTNPSHRTKLVMLILLFLVQLPLFSMFAFRYFVLRRALSPNKMPHVTELTFYVTQRNKTFLTANIFFRNTSGVSILLDKISVKLFAVNDVKKELGEFKNISGFIIPTGPYEVGFKLTGEFVAYKDKAKKGEKVLVQVQSEVDIYFGIWMGKKKVENTFELSLETKSIFVKKEVVESIHKKEHLVPSAFNSLNNDKERFFFMDFTEEGYFRQRVFASTLVANVQLNLPFKVVCKKEGSDLYLEGQLTQFYINEEVLQLEDSEFDFITFEKLIWNDWLNSCLRIEAALLECNDDKSIICIFWETIPSLNLKKEDFLVKSTKSVLFNG